ncbi:MAG TPA: hypothetical protein VH702_19775 [Vicinamibacterales bacterium]|jgi:hypothetical protein
MNEMTRQRLWLIVVLVLGIIAASQFVSNRNLRAELNRTQAEVTGLREQMDARARQVAADMLGQRRHELIAAGQWLHAFYQAEEGLKRPEGLWIDGHPDFEGLGAWLFDVYLAERFAGATDEAARQKVAEGIKQSEEWRRKHPVK